MGKGSSKSSLTGYRYYFDLLMGVCRGPVDAIVAIRCGDIEAWPGNIDANSPATTGPHPMTDAADLQALFNPGAEPPQTGFFDQITGAVNSNARFSINKPNLFGGDKGEGGLIGNITVLMGAYNQIIPADIKTSISTGTASHTYTFSPSGGVGVDSPVTGDGNLSTIEDVADISEFRGVTTLFYSGTVTSNNPYPKTWKIRTQRAYTGWDRQGCWYPAKAMIQMGSGDYVVRGMNPAHIVYQVLTDQAWGRGMSRTDLDDVAFRYAADYLYAEGFGLCMSWERSKDVSDFLQDVINHINGALMIDRGTGLVRLKLIRSDYDGDTLPVFDYSSGLLSVESAEAVSNSITPNEVIVKWHDPEYDEDRQVRVQNEGAIHATGAIITDTKEYQGIGDAGLAMRCAKRDLKVYASSLKKFKLNMDRRAWKMQAGSVMKITALDKNIASMIVRVLTYDDSDPDGKLVVEVCQDVFGMPADVYEKDPGRIRQGPATGFASPPVSPYAYEASYLEMQVGLTAELRGEVTSTEGGVIALAGRPNASTLSGEVVAGITGTGDMAISGAIRFAPTAVIYTAMDYTTTVLQMISGTDLSDVETPCLALISGVSEGDPAFNQRAEFVRVDSISLTTGGITVSRGVVDTIPKQHAANSTIYFHAAIKAGYTAPYTSGESVDVEILTRTNRDILDPSLAVTDTVVVQARWMHPYPPAGMTLNGHPAQRPLSAPYFISGDAVFAWTTRNKVLQADQLVGTLEGPVAPEAGTTYTVEVWTSDTMSGSSVVPGALLRSYTGITATTWTYYSTDAAAAGDPVLVDIVIYAVVNGLASLDKYRLHLIKLAEGAGGYGNTYGYGYSQPPTP